MSIQRYRTNHIDGDIYETSEGEFVTYADHVAEVERVRTACIAAVENVPVRGTWTAHKVIEETLAALRKIQP